MTSVANNLVFCYQQKVGWQRRFTAISCMATTSNEFKNEILSLKTSSADVDQLKKAYRKLALRYHPDVCDPSVREESTRMFIELQTTYVNLLDQGSPKTVTSDTRSKWESQLLELKRRSYNRREQKDGSWGCRMRTKHQDP